jgi:hypothetical protein
MTHPKRLIMKRDKLVSELTSYSDAVSGNLSKGAVPPGSKNCYWRITWKENQKTKIQYVRPEAVAAFNKGIEQFNKLKKIVQQIGDINRTVLSSQQKRSS